MQPIEPFDYTGKTCRCRKRNEMCLGNQRQILHTAATPDSKLQECLECRAILSDQGGTNRGPNIPFFRTGTRVAVLACDFPPYALIVDAEFWSEKKGRMLSVIDRLRGPLTTSQKMNRPNSP